MATDQNTLEVVATTVEEAIERGLDDLKLSIDDVEIETQDEGSKGFLGLGMRQAKIKITLKPGVTSETLKKLAAAEQPKPEKVEKAPEKAPQKTPEKKAPVKAEPSAGDSFGEDPILQTARETVSELLEKMHVFGQVTATYTDVLDENGQAGVLVEVSGDDLSILIGRKSETLNSLQYVTSLIIGKKLAKWVPLSIDVEGYRGRRERQLKQLALRMAEQAVSTGRRQTLEPMPANERRIIHLALRDHPQVVTESTGDEPNRKLTIVPKKN
jgi:spoIIIJ-associated protein